MVTPAALNWIMACWADCWNVEMSRLYLKFVLTALDGTWYFVMIWLPKLLLAPALQCR